jgi:hypothetical protein
MVSYEPAMRYFPVQPANGNTKWYPMSQQCKRVKKEKKRKGSIYPLAAMTWSWREVMVPMTLSS